jgi:recombinational DNA repair ATPase RecF
MTSIESEYGRFWVYLDDQNVDEDVRKLATLVCDNLDFLAEVGATRRARSSRLVPLAVRDLAGVVPRRGSEHHQVHEVPGAFRLDGLTVGPFRGFMESEEFDLGHDITLVYGANGTGKSSFCEALETAMLGSISEARAKRVDHEVYCNNARLRRHVTPVLTVRTEGRDATELVPDESEFRFCFIEKNRLDDFARIAARTPGDQRQLIATLFGVDQFSEFVRGFNPALDETLTLVGPQATLLAQRRKQLAASEATVKGFPKRIAQIEQDEGALAQRILAGQGFGAACAWLLGTDNQPGQLEEVQAVVDRPTPTVRGVVVEKLTSCLTESRRLQGLWEEATRKLGERAIDVSFTQLYEAVSALEDGATACPACGTGLNDVKENPFERARQGLKDLSELAILQKQAEAHRENHAEAVRTLRAEMARVVGEVRAARGAEYAAAALPELPAVPAGDWWTAWETGDAPSAWTRLLGLAAEVEAMDAEARAAIAGRSAFVEERQRLDPLRLEVERLRTLRRAVQEDFDAAQATIEKFDEANKPLIEQVAAEANLIELHGRIKRAYDGFLPHLQRYLAGLPASLMQGLNEAAKNFYNAFNRGDPPGDLLHALSLPQAENEKIEVVFSGEQNRPYDALVVLSEGHIRCLGLAILLAKNIAQRCPVVIFDDVVNAIDDDHRNGIWRTFFEDGHLDGKQVILTSHAQEFLDRIQQELGAARAQQIKRFKFLPHNAEHELVVDTDPPTKNYVLRAQQALAEDERRDALKHSRPALEALTDQLWKWLGSRGDGRLDLKLTAPGAPYELNNKCLKLRGAVDRVTAQFPAAAPAVAALAALTGINGNSIEWRYLNGGVHDSERSHEFDGATVRTIVEAVTALDGTLATLRNPRGPAIAQAAPLT